MNRPSKRLVVRTRQRFSSSAHVVWPMLCNSKMDRSSTLLFKLGVPQPIECRLPEGQGGVGSVRECVSDQGVVRQRILVWVPEERLSFRMERADLSSAKSVAEVEDTFDLVARDPGVTVTRTTSVQVVGRFRWLKAAALYFGLKHVHRYVFRNWHRLAGSVASRGSGVPQGAGR